MSFVYLACVPISFAVCACAFDEEKQVVIMGIAFSAILVQLTKLSAAVGL